MIAQMTVKSTALREWLLKYVKLPPWRLPAFFQDTEEDGVEEDIPSWRRMVSWRKMKQLWRTARLSTV